MVGNFLLARWGGDRLWLNFYVCDVPGSVISVARRPQQGCKALSAEDSRLEGLSGEGMPAVRYGLLLFKCPKLVGLDPAEFSHTRLLRGLHRNFLVHRLSSQCIIMLILGYLTAPIIDQFAQACWNYFVFS